MSTRRTLVSGKVRNRTQERDAAAKKDVEIIQVQLEGDERRRFLAYKERADFPVSNAVAGKRLMLERLAQVETPA